MNFKEPKNKNYCATVVELSKFVQLTGCDNVQAAIIFGNSVIVGKEAKPGDVGLFFPVETAISSVFLGVNNLFRKPEFGNTHPDKKGFFEEHGRVKCMKFRGHKSEGFYIPLNSLEFTNLELSDFPVGLEFDFVENLEICRKYVPRGNKVSSGLNTAKKAKTIDRLVPGQFQFHIDTEQLRKNVHKIYPDSIISISDKWHGTSAIFSKVLVKRDLSLVERFLRWVGVRVIEAEYGFTWASRRVIKGVAGEERKNSPSFYDDDIWGIVGKEVEAVIPNGFTLYGEIVGYTPSGSTIQPGYHYGCDPGTHKFIVYRVTSTNVDGKVLELGWPQMKEFCAKYSLDFVEEFYYGTAAVLFRDFKGQESYEDWQAGFLAHLQKLYVKDQMCPHNNNEVPAEGVVLRIEHLEECESYKCKNFKFLK